MRVKTVKYQALHFEHGWIRSDHLDSIKDFVGQKLISVEEKDEKFARVFLHPRASYRQTNPMSDRLKARGWVCTDWMVDVEGYLGFGSSWQKPVEELTEWDLKIAIPKYDYA